MRSCYRIFGTVTLLTLFLLATLTANAQFGGGMGGGMPPGMKAKIEKMRRKMATNSFLKLTQLTYQLHETDENEPTRLTKPQAAKLLPILQNWRTKTTMTEEQAKSVSKQLMAPLNEKQLKRMATIKAPWSAGGTGGGGFGGWGGGGMRGGMGGWGGGRGKPGGGGMLDALSKPFNPLNPDTVPFESQRPTLKKAEDDLIADLQKRTKA